MQFKSDHAYYYIENGSSINYWKIQIENIQELFVRR